jgi:alcohol dehydrogenase, propanol-preferring
MLAMVLNAPGKPLEKKDVPVPEPGQGQVLIRVLACGVCRTDLHIMDGELEHPKLPLIMGHEVVGEVVRSGPGAARFKAGQRVGVPWLGCTCGICRYCLRGDENLCENPDFTGYTQDGGYAEFMVADERFCFNVPKIYDDAEAAPLMCAGLIGYRSYRMIGKKVDSLGIYGFGAAAHIIAQVAVGQGVRVFAFTSPGDTEKQEFARSLGVVWAGGSDQLPPQKLDAAIIFAPVGALVPTALQAVDKGGRVVCGGIHMSDIPAFPYHWLWEERSLVSVANLTRADGEEFMEEIAKTKIHLEIQRFRLEEANDSLNLLRRGKIRGAAVLEP